MGVEPFRLAERDGGRPERRETLRAAFQDRCALHEVENAQSGRKTGRTGRRQDMIGAADIIADCFGCVSANEDRASIDSRNI